MTTCKFFTILKTYLHCCNTREDLVAVHKKNDNCIDNSDEDKSPIFDSLSSGTPKTWSSSSSSLSLNEDEYKQPTMGVFNNNQLYKRGQFQPYIGIIPAKYYSD